MAMIEPTPIEKMARKMQDHFEPVPIDRDFSGDVDDEYLSLPICEGCGRHIEPTDAPHTFCYPGM